jgi:DNA excision repair protein ERCC-6-like
MQSTGRIKILPSSFILGQNVPRSESDDDDAEDCGSPSLALSHHLQLPSAMETRLMDHQKVGVDWMYSLYLSGSGGILGDDMGLGKTYQVISLLAGLMKLKAISRVLILAPVSVLPSWYREIDEQLKPHFGNLLICNVLNADLTKKKRLHILDTAFQQPSTHWGASTATKIVISSYHLVSNMIDEFANRGKWDYVVLDEGHIIKNPATKISKSMHFLNSNHRLLLSGTPIQNNLTEFWAIVNWVTKGKRFGTLPSFKQDFSIPIVEGQDPRATPDQRRIAAIAAKNLLKLTKPILLQRKKCELISTSTAAEEEEDGGGVGASGAKGGLMSLPEKVELVVWTPLASTQRELYEKFLQSRQFLVAVNRATCPVEVINHLKTVCRHPLLIEALDMNRRRRAATAGVGGSPTTATPRRSKPVSRDLYGDDEGDEDGDGGMAALTGSLEGLQVSGRKGAPAGSDEAYDAEEAQLLHSLPANANLFDVIQREPAVPEMLRGSIKLRVLLKLVRRLHLAGHRTLVFSQSRLMLDIIQRVLAESALASYRIDGSVSSSSRQRTIDEFNAAGCDRPSVCLLTTKACGVGITLTGADRVIVYDPCK